jgi:NADH:ubiquinone oxidoreductase subunit H
MGFAAHIAYERFGQQNSPRSAALHVAFAVALGAFGLAVGAVIHSLSAGSTNQHRQLLLLSLGIWPVMTALPAFLVALGTSVILARALGSGRSK